MNVIINENKLRFLLEDDNDDFLSSLSSFFSGDKSEKKIDSSVNREKKIISNDKISEEGFIIVNNNKNDNNFALVFGGTPSSKYGAKFMYDKATLVPSFINKKNVIFSDWENSIDKAYAFLKSKFPKSSIKSVSGFSKGGRRAFPAIGGYDFVGLIDPSIEGKYQSVQVGVSDPVFMIYQKNRGWGSNGLKYAINKLGGNRVKSISLGHLEMPKYFFENYGDRL